MKTELCEIMTRNKSDKGSGHHNYTLEYHTIFNSQRNTVKNIFEVGLGTNNVNVPSNMGKDARPGSSLYGWKEYFPNANIFGADVDSGVLFEEERIKTFFVDQTKENTINEMWNNDVLKDIQFDIIIDDGLHELNANINFLKHSFQKLDKNGVFIIEDVVIGRLNDYVTHLNNLKDNLCFTYIIKILHNDNNPYDNCLIFIYPK